MILRHHASTLKKSQYWRTPLSMSSDRRIASHFVRIVRLYFALTHNRSEFVFHINEASQRFAWGHATGPLVDPVLFVLCTGNKFIISRQRKVTLQCDRLSVLLIMGVSLVMNGQSLNHRTGNRLSFLLRWQIGAGWSAHTRRNEFLDSHRPRLCHRIPQLSRSSLGILTLNAS